MEIKVRKGGGKKTKDEGVFFFIKRLKLLWAFTDV